MPSTSYYSPTGDAYVDGVLSGVKWGVTSLTFSFPPMPRSRLALRQQRGRQQLQGLHHRPAERRSRHPADVFGDRQPQLCRGDRDRLQSRRSALRQIQCPSTAWAYYPSTSQLGGDVWANNTSHWYDNPVKGNYAFLTFIHETGHALGLEQSAGCQRCLRQHAARPRLARVLGDELPLLCRRGPRRLHQQIDQLSDYADDVRHRRAAGGVSRRLHHPTAATATARGIRTPARPSSTALARAPLPATRSS